MKFYKIGVFLLCIFSINLRADDTNCPDGELSFAFSDLPVKSAFQLFANFANLTPVIDPTISGSTPINFSCTPWKVAAMDLANKYNLKFKVENGVMYVSK